MEALAALSLAGNIIQIIDFSSTAVKRCLQIYRSNSGLSDEYIWIKETSAELSALNATLSNELLQNVSVGQLSREDQALFNLAVKCKATADRLSSTLLKIKPKSSSSLFASAWKSIRIEFSKREIENIAREMNSYTQLLETRLLVNLRSRFHGLDIDQKRAFAQLNEKMKNLLQLTVEGKKLISDHNIRLDELQLQLEAHSVSQHEGTRLLVREVKDELEKKQQQQDQGSIDFGDAEVQRLLRETLRFPEQDMRQEEIDPAHKDTFRWVLDDEMTEISTWPSFTNWLQHGGGIYWFEGNPGSGKSTLMNVIRDDSRTKQYLTKWAGDRNIACGFFYFWHAGVPLQKSISGLLRSLIFQMLQQYPVFTSTCFAIEDEIRRVLDNPQDKSTMLWTENRLRSTFNNLIHKMTPDMKICFFVDGLDESNSDPAKLSELIVEIVAYPNVKAIVSSRPFNESRYYFAGSPQLRLQDLTYQDIEKYVTDRLGGYISLEPPKEDPDLQYFIRTITDNSSGIFIWTKLVVNSVIEGFRNLDPPRDILTRIMSLPSDLDALYQRMLLKLEENPAYFKSAAELFQLIDASEERLPLGPPDLQPIITILDLVFGPDLTTSAAISAPLKHTALDVLEERCKTARTRLASICACFAEISVKGRPNSEIEREILCSPGDDILTKKIKVSNRAANYFWRPLQKQRVQFIHRSVRDFLKKEDIWRKICNATVNSDFHIHHWFLLSTLMQIKSCAISELDLYCLVWRAMTCAKLVERGLNIASGDELDHLDYIGHKLLQANLNYQKRENDHWVLWLSAVGQGLVNDIESRCEDFDSLVVKHRLVLYVNKMLLKTGESSLRTPLGRPLLEFCFQGPIRLVGESWYRSKLLEDTSMVTKVLLQHGASPSIIHEGLTPWQMFLHTVFEAGIPKRTGQLSQKKDADQFFENCTPHLDLFFKMITSEVDLQTTIHRLASTSYGYSRNIEGQYFETFLEITAYGVFAEYHEESCTQCKAIHDAFVRSGAKKEMRKITIITDSGKDCKECTYLKPTIITDEWVPSKHILDLDAPRSSLGRLYLSRMIDKRYFHPLWRSRIDNMPLCLEGRVENFLQETKA